MKGTNIGEFEELVLLTVAALVDEAYSVSICDELHKNTGRKVKLGVVHAVLNRLEKKGFLESHLGGSTNKRGGKRKRFFTITHAGKVTLRVVKEQRERLWESIPDFVFKGVQI